MFGWDFDAQVWLRFWSWILINLWYDLTKILWWENSTPGSGVPKAMFGIYSTLSHPISIWRWQELVEINVLPCPNVHPHFLISGFNSGTTSKEGKFCDKLTTVRCAGPFKHSLRTCNTCAQFHTNTVKNIPFCLWWNWEGTIFFKFYHFWIDVDFSSCFSRDRDHI